MHHFLWLTAGADITYDTVMITALKYVVVPLWCCLLFLPLCSATDVPFFRDHSNQFLAYRWQLTAAPALWFDGHYLGTPAYADPQYGFWHPQTLLFRALPFPLAYNTVLLLHFAGIAGFTYLLARGGGTAAGLFAAVAVAGSGTVLSLSEFPSNLASFAMLFPLLWACRTAPAHPQRLLFLPPLLFCSFTAGGAVYAAVNLLVAVVLLLRLVRRGELSAPAARRAGLLAGALCLLPLFYFAQFYLHSPLAGAGAGDLDFRLEAGELLKTFVPWLNHWTEFSFSSNYPFLYAGVTVAGLFLAGIRHAPHAAAGAAGLTLLAAFGSREFPLHLFRYPEKLYLYAVLCAIVVALAAFRRLRGRVQWLLLGVLMTELLVVNRACFLTMPFATLLAEGRATGAMPGARVMTYVSPDLLPQFTGSSLPAYHREQFRYHYGLTALFYGETTFLGYSPARLAVYERLRQLHARRDLPAGAVSALLQNCGVSRVYARTAIHGRPFAGAPDWSLLLRDDARDLQVFSLPQPLPDALLISPDALAGMQQPEDALRLHAYTPVPGAVIRSGQASFRCRVENPAYLVLQTLVYPGMRLYVDGKETPYDTVFGAYPAVAVATGEHGIELKRLPTLLPLTLGTFLLGVCYLLRAVRRP